MKKTTIILTFFSLILLTGCNFSGSSSQNNQTQERELVTNQETSQNSNNSEIEASPINDANDAKTAVNDLTKDIDEQISDLDITTDFTDTTNQDFSQ